MDIAKNWILAIGSISQPHVRLIERDKAAKMVEYGAKLDL